jgi:RNA polymerase sigma factor (sigma-70 family)
MTIAAAERISLVPDAAAQTTRTLSDEELACAARAGSVASFDELARRVQVPLVRFLSRKFPSRSDAEDVAQDALIRAYVSLPTYRDGHRFRPWLFTIAYRLAVSRGRSDSTAVAMPDSYRDERATSPSEDFEARDRHDRIWSVARAVLSDEQVAALWLYYVEDLPAGDVAKVLGRSWVSVKTMLHRARKKLEPHLAAEVGVAARDELAPVSTGGTQ